MKIAILGPGGVGGLLAGALEHARARVTLVARESTARLIEAEGLRVNSVLLGDFHVRPHTVARLQEPVDVLIVATKASGLDDALERVAVQPRLVLPLLNGLDHLALLRERFGARGVVAGTIRVEADRPVPGVIVHTSRFLRVDIATGESTAGDDREERVRALAQALEAAGVSTRVQASEPQVMWSKLVRLNALACTTSAFDKLLGEIRDTPALRVELLGAIEEGAAVARAEGAELEAASALGELTDAHATLGSSMQRDIAAGRTPELDAIAGAVLRAGARHGIPCPTIQRLAGLIAVRAGIPAPVVSN